MIRFSIFIIFFCFGLFINAQVTGITVTDDNGVKRVTDTQNCNNATIIGETVVLDNGNSRLRATSASGLLVESSQIKCDSDISGSNDNNAPITYGPRGNTANRMRITKNSSILFAPLSARKNIFLSELSNSDVIESNNTGQLFVYTQTDAVLQNCLFRGINVWEVYRSPSIAANIKVENATFGYLNWEAGRLDFLGFAVDNISNSHAWLGSGNGGNNSVYHWNNDPSFDNTRLRLQNTNGRYFEGYTTSWQFIDRDTNTGVDDVLIIYDDDFSGVRSEVARYITNTDGKLTGTYDSQNQTTGTNQERSTLFLFTAKSDISGSKYSSGGGNTYDIDVITPYIEIRSFLHLPPNNYSNQDSFSIAAPIGRLNPDFSVNTFRDFILIPDMQITETNRATVLNYATLENSLKFYDRAKAEWRINDDYPIINRNGDLIDAGNYNIVIDATAAQTYSFSVDTITIKASVYEGNVQTTGTITLLNGATFAGAPLDVNGDSFFNFENVASWEVYNSENNALNSTNSIASGLGIEGYKFNFSPNDTYYFRLFNTNGDSFVYRSTPIETGITKVSFSEATNSLSKKLQEVIVLLENHSAINSNVKKASLVIPADADVNQLTTSNTTSMLPQGNPAGGSSDSNITFTGAVDWYIYGSENDAQLGTNLLANGSENEAYQYTFANGVFFYVAIYNANGARLIQKITPNNAGNSSISFNDADILTQLNNTINTIRANQNIINNNVKKTSLTIPATENISN